MVDSLKLKLLHTESSHSDNTHTAAVTQFPTLYVFYILCGAMSSGNSLTMCLSLTQGKYIAMNVIMM